MVENYLRLTFYADNLFGMPVYKVTSIYVCMLQFFNHSFPDVLARRAVTLLWLVRIYGISATCWGSKRGRSCLSQKAAGGAGKARVRDALRSEVLV